MKNPLRESPGKGDAPRNCHTKKFRKNYDQIDWKSDWRYIPDNGDMTMDEYLKEIKRKKRVKK